MSNRPSTPRERETWSKAEVRKFLAKAPSDRLYAAWRLSLYGLRRGEVLGLRWPDIDLRAGTLTVNQARVLVEYRVRIEEPKSRNGKRRCRSTGELVAALTMLRKRRLEESTIAGAAYRSGLAGLDWYQGGEYVITDEAGTPVHPEWYSDEFGRLLRRAGLPRITLHDSRHTTLTLSFNRDVPQEVVRVLLDHDSHRMTSHYAKITDQTVRRHWEQATKVNINGERVTLDPDGPLGQAQWAKTRYGMATQTLPNGYCGLPIQKSCPHANA